MKKIYQDDLGTCGKFKSHVLTDKQVLSKNPEYPYNV